MNEAVVLLPATLGGSAFGGMLSIQVEMGSQVALLFLRTSNSRVKEKCERIKSEHNGVVNSLWFRCLGVAHHWALIGWFLMDHEISHAFTMSMMITYLHNCFSNPIQLSTLIPLTSTSPLAFTPPSPHLSPSCLIANFSMDLPFSLTTVLLPILIMPLP